MPDHVKLFIPGPTEVRPDVLAEMARPLISHRGEDIATLQRSVSGQVAKIMGRMDPTIAKRITSELARRRKLVETSTALISTPAPTAPPAP